MTLHEEYRLYKEDRKAWARFIAPRWRAMLQSADREGRGRLWSQAGPELREALHALADQAKFEATLRDYGSGDERVSV